MNTQQCLRITTRVLPGGKIELTNQQLPLGQDVDVLVVFPSETITPRQSVMDVLAEAPGHLSFPDAEAVDAYLAEERDAWER